MMYETPDVHRDGAAEERDRLKGWKGWIGRGLVL